MKYKFKKKLKKILAISMALSMVLCTNAFATPIDLVNSTESVVTDTLDKSEGTDHFEDEDTNIWANGQIIERVDVTVQRGSKFEVTIPKDIILDGETGTADYIVNAKGDIAGNQVLKVIPDAEFEMTEAGGKASVTATVTQENTEYTYDLMTDDGTDYPGSVSATLTAGEWEGSFNFNINFEGGESNSTSLPEVKATLNDYTWKEISSISKSGEAQATYGLKIGDTKEITLSNGETYNIQIIGFNHDDLADGSGKAGITFQFKEVLTEPYIMMSSDYNEGGWETSEMRSYLQNNIYNSLPSNLRSEIKEVSKISDTGMDYNTYEVQLNTTTDKLFLLSMKEVDEEIGGFPEEYLQYQGELYEFFTNNNNRIKYNLNGSTTNWWLRSSIDLMGFSSADSSSYTFIYVNSPNESLGVCPAFCI